MIEKIEEIKREEIKIKTTKTEDIMVDMRRKKFEDNSLRLIDSLEENSKDKENLLTSLKKSKNEGIFCKGPNTDRKSRINNRGKTKITQIKGKIESLNNTETQGITDKTETQGITETIMRETEDENFDYH